jgi:hypothetical protein
MMSAQLLSKAISFVWSSCQCIYVCLHCIACNQPNWNCILGSFYILTRMKAFDFSRFLSFQNIVSYAEQDWHLAGGESAEYLECSTKWWWWWNQLRESIMKVIQSSKEREKTLPVQQESKAVFGSVQSLEKLSRECLKHIYTADCQLASLCIPFQFWKPGYASSLKEW